MPPLTTLQAKVQIDTSDIAPQLESTQRALTEGLGSAAQQAQLRVDSLSQRIEFQKRQLSTLGAELAVTRAKYGDEAEQVDRLKLRFDQLSASIGNNERQLSINRQRLEEAGQGASTAERYFAQFGASASSSLLGIVGPAAAAGAAINGLVSLGGKIKDSIEFAAELDESRRSLVLLQGNVRDGNAVYEQAIAFGQRYGYTQREIADASRDASAIIRASKAPVDDILGVLARLAQIDPVQGLQGAAVAVRELTGGDVTSLAKRFEVPRDIANQMKREIEGGADAVTVLNKYLADSGVGMELLDNRTKGAMGKLRELRQEQEQLAKAAAGEFGGLGSILVDLETRFTVGLTRLLGGEGGLSEGGSQLTRYFKALGAEATEYAKARLQGATAEEAQRAAFAAANAVLQENTNEWKAGGGAALQYVDAVEQAGKVNTDYVDTSKLTTEQLKALQDKFQSTGDKAAQAYQAINDAREKYLADSAKAGDEHEKKLNALEADTGARIQGLRQESAQRLADIDDQAHQRALELARASGEQRAKLEQATARELARQADDYADEDARRQREYGERVVNARAESAKKIADLERQINDARVADVSKVEEQRADAYARAADALAQQQSDAAQRLADLRENAQEQSVERARAYQERLTELEADYAQRRADQAQDRAQQAADHAEDLQRDVEDRARDHAERLAEIQNRTQEQQATGRIATLTGERFTVAIQPGESSGNSIAKQLADEERRYQEQERKAQEAEARAAEREKRQQERADAAADRAYQKQLEQAERQRQQQEANDAAQLAKQEAALAQQQEAQERAYQRQLEQADAAAQKQRAALDEQLAAQIAKLQEAIGLERQAERDKEADLAAAYAQQQEDTEAQRAKQAARRKEDYELQLAEQRENLQRQLEQNDAAAAAQADKQRAQLTEQIAREEENYAKQREAEQTRYAEQEAARTDAYLKQKEGLEKALGEQLKAYTEAQVNLGLIAKSEGEKRLGIIQDIYGQEAKIAREAFDAQFGQDFGIPADRSYDSIEEMRAARPSNGGPGALNIGSIVLPNVQKPSDFLPELRAEVGRQIAANGGDVSKYWSNR